MTWRDLWWLLVPVGMLAVMVGLGAVVYRLMK